MLAVAELDQAKRWSEVGLYGGNKVLGCAPIRLMLAIGRRRHLVSVIRHLKSGRHSIIACYGRMQV